MDIYEKFRKNNKNDEMKKIYFSPQADEFR